MQKSETTEDKMSNDQTTIKNPSDTLQATCTNSHEGATKNQDKKLNGSNPLKIFVLFT